MWCTGSRPSSPSSYWVSDVAFWTVNLAHPLLETSAPTETLGSFEATTREIELPPMTTPVTGAPAYEAEPCSPAR